MASPQAQGPNLNRSRTGYLGALTKLYKSVDEIVSSNAPIEDAVDILNRINARYERYLESHDLCLAANPKATPSFKFRMIWHNKSTMKFVFCFKPTSLAVLSQQPHPFAVS